MSLRTWLVLFVISMAVSAKALAWAVQHGQFRQVNRARWAPLRTRAAAAAFAPPARRRPWMLTAILVGLVAMLLVWMNGMVQLVISAFGH